MRARTFTGRHGCYDSPRVMVLQLTPRRPRWLRARAIYFALAIGTIALGLAVNRRGGMLSPAARDVLGDALWAAMMTWWVAMAVPAARLRWRASVALAVCFAVELSQLYDAPVLDALRRTTAGQLTLGTGFDPRDFAAYAAGVLATVTLEPAIARRFGRPAIARPPRDFADTAPRE